MMSPEMADIVESFELLGDWDARYQYLVEIGERLDPMPTVDKTEQNRVRECMSLVHVVPHPVPEGTGRIAFRGDCDTAIIKGVVAILVGVFSNKTPDEIEALDVEELFEALQLQEHLSPNRHVGVYAIVNKMKSQARDLGARPN
jgi:cysteine desulfuration protein SufE